jgi:hypothetical protein
MDENRNGDRSGSTGAESEKARRGVRWCEECDGGAGSERHAAATSLIGHLILTANNSRFMASINRAILFFNAKFSRSASATARLAQR